eukprot:CAMPEP_0119333772 /NCGR_PEP_ID=MMETSP1333-20130426/85950_1 /TAXON_ID=418940 /ORGANISM="Scyphosphaera apsteinii, Strain RCC1455" /LENGTH=241 /DNA_ID=CAMNT_0007343927 /DNA_START=114 /DNA_END=839 /DNA_ORIENTATION=+
MRELSICLPSGTLLAACSWGRPSSSHRVLALHGWMDNAATFTSLGPGIAHQCDCYVVAIDLPGHGRSATGASPSGVYHYAEHVLAAAGALEALGWFDSDHGFSLLGHSMGGGVCTMLAAAYTEFTRRLGLVEGLGPLSRPTSLMAKQLRSSLDAVLKESRGRGSRSRHYDTISAAAAARVLSARRLPGTQYITEASARVLAERGCEPIEAGRFRFSHDRRLALPSPVPFAAESNLLVDLIG